MNPNSTNSFLFEKIDSEFFAPYFIIDEFERYQEECLRKSNLNNAEFQERKQLIFSKINFIKFENFKNLVKLAKEFCPDENDVFILH